jgi:cytidyltransferase-like protein
LVDQQLAKLGDIENLASSMEGVVFEYPPGSDKIYKLTGAFAMANQIIGRARRSGMTEEMEEDPVAEVSRPKTVAVVPGAFKPPHKGHLDMVRKYADMADEVVVIISKPTKQGRYLPDGTEITSEDSLKIWQTLAAGLSNVRIEASKDHASPVTAAYDFIGDKGPLNIGDTVILGASTKDDDWKRWLSAKQYVKDGVKLIDPERSAVSPTTRPSGEPYSATAFRNALGGATENRAEIADFVGEENVDTVLDILGLSAVEEMSGAGGGAGAGLTGAPVPLAYGSARPKKKRSKQKEYIDLSLIDEVIELIMKRGITK